MPDQPAVVALRVHALRPLVDPGEDRGAIRGIAEGDLGRLLRSGQQVEMRVGYGRQDDLAGT